MVSSNIAAPTWRRHCGARHARTVTTDGVVLILYAYTALVAFSAMAQSPPVLREDRCVHHDLSPPLRDIVPREPTDTGTRTVPLRRAHAALASTTRRQLTGPVAADTPVSTVAGTSFDGLGLGFVGPQGAFVVNSTPPDPNGAVGTTQFVEWVNTSFAIFDKGTGIAVYGPVLGHTLWAGFGGPCESNNDGDPIAQYDKAANRWVLTQFAVTGGPPYFQCLAVSETPDATGAFHRYAFQFSDFNDYAKIGIWSDAYYLTFNRFQGSRFLGADICALERAAMLNGDPANSVCVGLPLPYDSLLPADVDGARAPPAGAAAYFINFGPDSLNLWSFHVDFLTPSQSALKGPTSIAVTAFTEACGASSCIPQADTQQKLDSLGDRLMQRLAYRNFGDHEAMGSIAMDKVGDIAVGYSVSDAVIHPGIRYTGRVPSDPVGTMEGERSIVEGAGSQTQKSRWGDYTSMNIDPVDDCTFWYVNEYLSVTGDYNWTTRIASFRFPSCADPTPTATGTATSIVATSTPSATPTVSITRSATHTSPPTRTATVTRTNTPSPTETSTRTPTLTRTTTATPTVTSTSSATRTETRTRTPTPTAMVIPTSSPSISATATVTESASATPSPTATSSETSTTTATASPSAAATPTPSATDTPAASPTATPLPSGSPTPSPAATPTPGAAVSCVGDCDGNRRVSVDELLTMVEVTLGNASVSACAPGDSSGDGQITVDEILAAVSNALNGCPAVPTGVRSIRGISGVQR